MDLDDLRDDLYNDFIQEYNDQLTQDQIADLVDRIIIFILNAK